MHFVLNRVSVLKQQIAVGVASVCAVIVRDTGPLVAEIDERISWCIGDHRGKRVAERLVDAGQTMDKREPLCGAVKQQRDRVHWAVRRVPRVALIFSDR